VSALTDLSNNNRKSPPMLRLGLIKKKKLLSESNTSNKKFMIFCRNPKPSTSNTVINIGYHASLRWEIRYGCICIKSASQDPIESSSHSDTDLIPSPRLWVRMVLNYIFPLFLACILYLVWIYFDHIFHLSCTLWTQMSTLTL